MRGLQNKRIDSSRNKRRMKRNISIVKQRKINSKQSEHLTSGSSRTKITLNIKGNSAKFSEGTDLRILTEAFKGTQSLIDKTYLYSEGKKRMTEEDYKNLQLTIKNFRDGSIEGDIWVTIKNTVLPIAPLVLEHSGDILTAIKNVYDFLKFKIQANKEGKTMEVTTSGDYNTVISVPGNNNTINVYSPPYVEELSNNLSTTILEMTRNIDGKELSKISLSTADSEFGLDIQDKETFKEQSFTSDYVFVINANIRKADANRYSGTLAVVDSNDDNIVIGSEYLFKSVDGVFNEINFKDCFSTERRFKCKKRINIGASNNYNVKVKEIIIIEII